MHVVIFAGGSYRPGKALFSVLARADLIIAADSGAATALQYGFTPAFVVGDLDSLDPQLTQQLRQSGSEVLQAPIEKDETDTELAVQLAIEKGATEITLLGALGGQRFDHAIANILLLAGFPTPHIRVIDGPTTCWLLRAPGRTAINEHIGDLLSLFPLTADARGIYTQGLYYPLQGGTLYFGKPRGISNVLTEQHAEVSLEEGMLLVIHTCVHEA